MNTDDAPHQKRIKYIGFDVLQNHIKGQNPQDSPTALGNGNHQCRNRAQHRANKGNQVREASNRAQTQGKLRQSQKAEANGGSEGQNERDNEAPTNVGSHAAANRWYLIGKALIPRLRQEASKAFDQGFAV